MNRLKNKQTLYTFCFFLIVLIEYFTKNSIGHGTLLGYIFEKLNNYQRITVNSGFKELARESLGIVLAILVLSHYTKSDFLHNRKKYFIWSGIWALGSILTILFGQFFYAWYPDDPWSFGYLHSSQLDDVILVNDFIYIMLQILLWGYVIITVVSDRIKKGMIFGFNCKLFIIWAVMMVWMFFSGSHYMWPFAYLVMFGCFYLTEYTKEEQNQLFHGILNGLLLGFAVIQTAAFVLYPFTIYEERYKGLNANSNWSALFYAIIFSAVLIKLIYNIQNKSALPVRLFYWFLCGAVLSLEFFTCGRSGYIAVAAESVVFLVVLCGLNFKAYIIRIASLILSFVIAFPITFAAVRYIPAFNPLSDGMKQYLGIRVPEINSDVYMSMDELLQFSLGRFFTLFKDINNSYNISYNDKISFDNSSFISNFVLSVHAEDLAADLIDTEMTEVIPPNKIPVFGEGESPNSIQIRATIYKYYLTHLKLTGQPYEEQGFQLQPRYWIGHAHNIYLQYATDFGIIGFMLWIYILVCSFFKGIEEYLQTRNLAVIGSLLFLMIPLIFGMFEYAWGDGALSIAMMFISGWYILRSSVDNK